MDVRSIPIPDTFANFLLDTPPAPSRSLDLEELEQCLNLAGIGVGTLAFDLEVLSQVFNTDANLTTTDGATSCAMPLPLTPVDANNPGNTPPTSSQPCIPTTTTTERTTSGANETTALGHCLAPATSPNPTTESPGAYSPLSDNDSEVDTELDEAWTPPSQWHARSTPVSHDQYGSCSDSGDDLPPSEDDGFSPSEWARMMTPSNVDQGNYGVDDSVKVIHAQHSIYAWPLPLLTMGSSPWIRITRTILKRQLRKEQLDDLRKTRRRLKQQGYSRVWRSRHH
eukprot:m.34908 g.34908  ORF g.34908 m.34908 type:complete len:282 (+) comp12351_c0_seq1:119-964(+)